ncbi:MAG: pyridoxal-phosphate dependent enzyme [Catenulispora sp.]|nr:pyridoxal-phosphate dependent enzyme [Catenulispora sp.]
MTHQAHLRRICGFIPATARLPAVDRTGGLREKILTYAEDSVRAAPPTPILEVGVNVAGIRRTVLLKLDGRSRWGSIKGRTAVALLASVAGDLGPDAEIIESTSGNLGVALAGICRELGLPFTAVVDSRLPPDMAARLTGFGARVVDADDGAPRDTMHLLRRIARVQLLLKQNPDAVWTNQYENPANVAVHRWWTGHELLRQLESEPPVQAAFAPVSTGGTFAGLRACLGAARPDLEFVAVDVVGSTIFGGPPGPRLLTGIGAGKPSAFLTHADRTPHVMVTDTEAIATGRALADDTGVAIGGSSGAALAGALHHLRERPDLHRVLCVCPDLGSNYEQTLYDDTWLLDNGAAEALGRPSVGGRKVVFTPRGPERR